jgi:hypothetical protein
MPCLSALSRDRLFPSSDFGPALFRPLRRLSSIFYSDEVAFSDLVSGSDFSGRCRLVDPTNQTTCVDKF